MSRYDRRCGLLDVLARPRLVVNALRLFWTAAILWFEFGAYVFASKACNWPDAVLHPASSSVDVYHVLLVADPQILNHRSYPERGPWLTRLSQFLVDWQLRKGWWATMRHLRPDHVVFLGDMMDGGRFNMPYAEYEAYFKRFKSIFRTDHFVPTHYIPGNHDIGLWKSSYFAPDARDRYTSHFGPLNQWLPVADHAFLMVDALGLLEENQQRLQQGVGLKHWQPEGGAFALIRRYAASNSTAPVILAIHVPLSRPDSTSCGPFRERGTIRAGRGFGYENLLGQELSDFILAQIRPTIIFSGDDHDYCELYHPVSPSQEDPRNQIYEVTLKSFSMAMGIRRPGFQVLSLIPPDTNGSSQSLAHALCLLPDQLSLYLSGYLPLVGLSLLALLISNTLSDQEARDLDGYRLGRARGDRSNGFLPVSTVLDSPKKDRRRHWTPSVVVWRKYIALPVPPGTRRCCSTFVGVLAGHGRRRQGSSLYEYGREVFDVAWPTLLGLALVAWRMFS